MVRPFSCAQRTTGRHRQSTWRSKRKACRACPNATHDKQRGSPWKTVGNADSRVDACPKQSRTPSQTPGQHFDSVEVPTLIDDLESKVFLVEKHSIITVFLQNSKKERSGGAPPFRAFLEIRHLTPNQSDRVRI